MMCRVAHLGFSGLPSFCIILQAIFADHCGSLLLCVGESLWILAPSPPSLPLSIFSVWQCQLMAAGRGGSHFQGCLVTSLPYYLHLASPTNLLGTSSQGHQLVMSSMNKQAREPITWNPLCRLQSELCIKNLNWFVDFEMWKKSE